MEFGASIFFTDYSISPTELAMAMEERGLDALWAAEHSHIPVPRRTPAPGGGELPKRYYDVMDPFVTLSTAAAVTKRLKLGTGVCLVIQRDTIQTASSGNPQEYLPRFREMAEEAGRDPKSLPVTLGGSPEDPDMLKRYRDLGVVRVNFPVPPAKADEVLPILDRVAKLKQQVGA